MIAFTTGDDLEFIEEFFDNLAKGLSFRKAAAPAVLTFETEIPILCDVLRLSEALLLRRSAKLVAADRGGALPKGAARPLENLDLAAEQSVSCDHWHLRNALIAPTVH
jgi:hypothetical protein